MKLPQPAGLLRRGDDDGAYIHNKYSGKDVLTRGEAIDLINCLSGILLVDDRYKAEKGGSDARYPGVRRENSTPI